MRACLAVCMVWGAWVSTAVAAPPSSATPRTFPYTAYVTTDDVYVRSGPGENYYPTEKVKAGTAVEVYRQDPGGWYAIRPLDDSFSWVSGRYLAPGQDGLAEVTSDKVAARVGSHFSDLRDIVQVRLHRGELVELRGTKQIGTGSATGTWHRIAPPSGEFRWVSAKFVDPDYSPNGVRKTSPAPSPQVSSAPATVQTSATTELPGPVTAAVAPAVSTAIAAPVAGPQPLAAETATAARALSPQQFQSELDDINVELSIMLAEEPTVWNCQELAERAQALVAQAQTAVERGHARVLSTRIAQAEDIKRRFEQVNQARADTDRRNNQLSEIARVRGTASTAVQAESRFDGVGRLTRVVPPQLGAPRYALVDDRGAVRCYVSPAPGVNMNYYVGRRVGVTGSRNFLADQRAELVTAKHVTSLDSRVR